jgi:hypothetical protein
MKAGFLFQLGGFWIGAHYSCKERRWCINLIPCCTLWVALKGGNPPYRYNKKKKEEEKCGATAVTTS